jgi:hypothetical protein
MLTKTVIAYDAGKPVHATKELLDWRKRAAAARNVVENLERGDEARTEALANYFEILSETRR